MADARGDDRLTEGEALARLLRPGQERTGQRGAGADAEGVLQPASPAGVKAAQAERRF